MDNWTDCFHTKNHLYIICLPIYAESDMCFWLSCYLAFSKYVSNNVFLQQVQSICYVDADESLGCLDNSTYSLLKAQILLEKSDHACSLLVGTAVKYASQYE